MPLAICIRVQIHRGLPKDPRQRGLSVLLRRPTGLDTAECSANLGYVKQVLDTTCLPRDMGM